MIAFILPIADESVVAGQALHIPDGFLSPVMALAMWALTIVCVGLAVRRVGQDLGERQVPLMGIMAAFIFAAQMINFPVAGGTSGHFLGGALAAILLGPWAGIVVMTVVVALQGLLFQDGGLLAMGANIFNMGVLTALIGFGLYRAAAGRGRWLRLGVAGGAAWLSVVAAALATALQLWLSGMSSLRVVMPAMVGVHLFIGLGEAVITVAALAFIELVRPDLVGASDTRERGGLGWVLGGLLVALAVVLLSPWASADPDGLERVAGDLGFLSAAQASPVQVLSDYTVPALGATSASTIIAGLIGALVVAGLVIGIARLLRRRAPAA